MKRGFFEKAIICTDDPWEELMSEDTMTREKIVLVVAETQYSERSGSPEADFDAAPDGVRADEIYFAERTVEELEKLGLLNL